MTKLIGRNLQGIGEVVIQEDKLAAGGEGAVHNVLNHEVPGLEDAENLVAKIYFKPNEANRGPKVAAMLSHPPAEMDSIAWVKALLFSPDKKFVGYLMEKLDTKSFRQWSELSNTKDRKQTAPEFDVRYALNASRNFLVALHFIHEAGHKIGDINESNLFINTDSTVMLVDTDSAQIDNGGTVYACEVGKPEFVASELSHGKLKDTPRTVETDIFAYSVMIFQMLTGGAHPMDGIYAGNDDPPNVTNKIREGVLPTLQPGKNKKFKPVPRIPASAIPSPLKNIMIQSLSNDPEDRPDSNLYLDVIDEVLDNLVQCKVEKRHWFDKRDVNCGWCVHKAAGNFDPWSENENIKPVSNVRQSSLPSVSFGDQAAAPKPRRAAPRLNSPQNTQNRPQAAQNAPYGQSPANASQSPQNSPGGYTSNAQPSPNNNQSHNPHNVYPNVNQSLPYRPDPPNKHKGKLVLEYADGSMRQRPSLSDLAKSNPKIAWHAFIEEYPNLIRVWWDKYRLTPRIPAVIVGLLIALAMGFAWFIAVLLLVPLLGIENPSWESDAIAIGAMLSWGFTWLASIILAISAFIVRHKDKKIFGKDGIQQEGFIKTVLRFIAVGFYYGPLFVVVLTIYVVYGVFTFMIAATKA